MGCQNAFNLNLVSLASLSQIGFRLSMFSVSRAGNFPKQPERGGLGVRADGEAKKSMSTFHVFVRLSGFERTLHAGKVVTII
jgi:hypothetical protein